MTATAVPTGVQLGYARVSTGHQALDQQLDALTAAGAEPKRVYRDKLSGTSTGEQRPGLAALLDYARPGDAIVVIGIDRLGRNAAEVMATIREFAQAAVVAAAMSVPVFAGAMIGSVPQAHANCVSQRGAAVPGGFARACGTGITPQLAKTLKDDDRAAGNKASGSQTAFGNFSNPKH